MSLNARKNPSFAPDGQPRRAGFTLVELMVSLVLLGVIMIIIFSLFSTTSDGLKEADSLVQILENTRFAAEQVGGDIKSAGAFATPDSEKDPWVINDANNNLCVYGVAGYKGGGLDWQNSTDLLGTGNKFDAHNDSGEASGVSYDGFIVMGAHDFPQTFEVSNLTFASPNGATIPGHARGMVKLLSNNPFYTDTALPASFPTAVEDNFIASLDSRLLRIADRDGNLQFSGITGAETTDENDAVSGVKLTLSPDLRQRQSAGDGSANQKGLDPQALDDEDVGYGAALIDAYWYHVEASPLDPANFRLVRDRLNAAEIAASLCDPDSTDPSTMLSNPEEKIVITDRVADFQVWFDCADTNGNLDGTDWTNDWASPLGAGDTEGCMDLSAPNFGAARMAHIRLSMHARDERKDAPDARDALYQWNDAADTQTGLRYFNMHPDAPGAARVVTVQTDIALPTFSMRNIEGLAAAP